MLYCMHHTEYAKDEFIKMLYNIQNNTVVFPRRSRMELGATFNCGQCFRWDEYEKGYRGIAGPYPRYTWQDEENIYAELLQEGGDMEKFARYMHHYLSLDVDYDGLKELFSVDPVMEKAIAFAPGIRVMNQPFFETLLTFIISRNNNIPRIKKIVDAMAQKYGTKVGDMYAFPTPRQLRDVSIEEYNELRMGFRSKYIFDRVGKILSGEVDGEKIKDMPYPEAKKYLMQIKGVGPKVADCVLLFGCEKQEAFPKDVWINRALEQLFPDGLPQCIEGKEGIAQQFIFQYARFNL